MIDEDGCEDVAVSGAVPRECEVHGAWRRGISGRGLDGTSAYRLSAEESVFDSTHYLSHEMVQQPEPVHRRAAAAQAPPRPRSGDRSRVY